MTGICAERSNENTALRADNRAGAGVCRHIWDSVINKVSVVGYALSSLIKAIFYGTVLDRIFGSIYRSPEGDSSYCWSSNSIESSASSNMSYLVVEDSILDTSELISEVSSCREEDVGLIPEREIERCKNTCFDECYGVIKFWNQSVERNDHDKDCFIDASTGVACNQKIPNLSLLEQCTLPLQVQNAYLCNIIRIINPHSAIEGLGPKHRNLATINYILQQIEGYVRPEKEASHEFVRLFTDPEAASQVAFAVNSRDLIYTIGDEAIASMCDTLELDTSKQQGLKLLCSYLYNKICLAGCILSDKNTLKLLLRLHPEISCSIMLYDIPSIISTGVANNIDNIDLRKAFCKQSVYDVSMALTKYIIKEWLVRIIYQVNFEKLIIGNFRASNV